MLSSLKLLTRRSCFRAQSTVLRTFTSQTWDAGKATATANTVSDASQIPDDGANIVQERFEKMRDDHLELNVP